MLTITSRRGRAITIALLIAVALGLAACGETTAPASNTNSAVEARETPSSVPEESAEKAAEAAPDKWATFTSDTDGFSVSMPGEPQTSTQSMDSALGELTFHFYQVADGAAQYAVTYNDYPAEMTADDLDPESVLSDAIAATAQGSEAENVRRIEVQGNPGIEGEINVQGSTHIWYRGILARNRLYQLIVAAPEGDKGEFAGDAGRFIESFELLAR